MIWVSPTLPGSRHDIAAAREHGILDVIDAAKVQTVAETGYQGAGPTVRVPQRRRRLDPDTGLWVPAAVHRACDLLLHARQERGMIHGWRFG